MVNAFVPRENTGMHTANISGANDSDFEFSH